jgi:hypothetical protein
MGMSIQCRIRAIFMVEVGKGIYQVSQLAENIEYQTQITLFSVQVNA